MNEKEMTQLIEVYLAISQTHQGKHLLVAVKSAYMAQGMMNCLYHLVVQRLRQERPAVPADLIRASQDPAYAELDAKVAQRCEEVTALMAPTIRPSHLHLMK